MISLNLQNPRLTQEEKLSLQNLLEEQDPNLTDNLEQICFLMNKVWDEMGCDNQTLDWDKIGKYYSHPVWLLNGLFIESHELSTQIREKIADYVKSKKFKRICDYGGGFGTLARNIATKCPDAEIFIYEPHPSHYGLECIKDFNNITFISELEKQSYDCIIATDVLEHIENPLQTFHTLIQSLGGGGGQALIANCFYPCIKCHLPQNFHYRYSFNHFAQKLGVEKLGKIPKTHATIFQKTADVDFKNPTHFEIFLSEVVFYCAECIKPIAKPILNFLRRKSRHRLCHSKTN